MHDCVNDFQILFYLPCCVSFVCMGGMRFEKMNFPYPNKRPRLFCFISEGVDHLVDFQRQILVRTNPKREHRVHCRFRGWTQKHWNVKFILTSVFDPINFFFEASFFLFIPKVIRVYTLFSCTLQPCYESVFTIKEVLWDEEWEIDFLMVGSLHLSMSQRVNEFHGFPTIWPPHIHALDWIAFVDQFRSLNNEWVPFVEVLFFRRNAAFGLTRSLAHGCLRQSLAHQDDASSLLDAVSCRVWM